jgi:hypothetical protein
MQEKQRPADLNQPSDGSLLIALHPTALSSGPVLLRFRPSSQTDGADTDVEG